MAAGCARSPGCCPCLSCAQPCAPCQPRAPCGRALLTTAPALSPADRPYLAGAAAARGRHDPPAFKFGGAAAAAWLEGRSSSLDIPKAAAHIFAEDRDGSDGSYASAYSLGDIFTPADPLLAAGDHGLLAGAACGARAAAGRSAYLPPAWRRAVEQYLGLCASAAAWLSAARGLTAARARARRRQPVPGRRGLPEWRPCGRRRRRCARAQRPVRRHPARLAHTRRHRVRPVGLAQQVRPRRCRRLWV